MNTPTDFTYTLSGGFIRIYPNTPQAEEVYNDAAKDNGGTMNYLTLQKDDVLRKLRAAGYTVRKATKKDKMTTTDVFASLKELGL